MLLSLVRSLIALRVGLMDRWGMIALLRMLLRMSISLRSLLRMSISLLRMRSILLLLLIRCLAVLFSVNFSFSS